MTQSQSNAATHTEEYSLKYYGKIFLNAIYSGLFIGIAGTVFLAVPNRIAGAIFFAFALLSIICYSFKLFTGAVGYLAVQKKNTFFPYLFSLILIWLGNLAGCFAVGVMIRSSRVFPLFEKRVAALCADKMTDSFTSLLILAFFCGILMYVGVETFRKEKLPGFVRGIMVFLCVIVFILSGFEHSIAGMYYFAVAGEWNMAALKAVGIMTLGNALGGMLIPFGDKFRN